MSTDDKTEYSNARRIRQLKRELYSRNADPVISRERRDLPEEMHSIEEEWQPEETSVTKIAFPFMKLFVGASILFFIVALVFSFFLVIRPPAISPDNVVIDIEGPASIGGGEELNLQITVRNDNQVPIENADIIIEYPAGTRSAVNINTELPRHREALETLAPGAEQRLTVDSILFGEEGNIKDIKVVVEFRVQDSNAIFQTDAVYQLVLATSPLSLVIDVLDEAISGQEITMMATIKSNSKDTIEDVLFQIEYPFGFEFIEAQPSAIFADRLWQLGDIEPEAEQVIKVRGRLVGQDGEERIFRYSTGIESDQEPNTLESAFINITESIFVQKPFLSLDLALNGDNSEIFAVDAGDGIRGDITWTNNLPTQLFDPEIEVFFSGDVLNERSITADAGFYESINDRAYWNGETDQNLRFIAAGETGRASFSFRSHGLASGIPFRNPEMQLVVNVRATRLSETNVPEAITSTLARNVRINSDLILSAKALHASGPLTNTGPIPPRAEEETTYTLLWTVTNSSNKTEDVVVTGSIPPYVEWNDVVSNPLEDITFNPIGGQITWNVGDLEPGTGSVLPAREIGFQVTLLPSVSQIDTNPELLENQFITGVDAFTQTKMSSTKPDLTTTLSDPGSTVLKGKVVE